MINLFTLWSQKRKVALYGFPFEFIKNVAKDLKKD